MAANQDKVLNNERVRAGCCFVQTDGHHCSETLEEGSQFCYWHIPGIDKTGPEVSGRLEKRAKTGKPMDGFCLQGANLENIYLVNPEGEPYQLINSDLSRANLRRAHLYKADLSGSRLLKADLSHANLHFCNLSACNLLGTNFKNALLEHVYWGEELYQETRARQLPEQEVELYQEAEEVARNIRRHCEAQGILRVSGHFFYREMVFRRLQMPKFSGRRFLSWIVDRVSGYGESPIRVVLFSGFLVFCCSLVYFYTGIQDSGRLIQYMPEAGSGQNFRNWLDCIYFSVVTFTTLGYGDLTPLGWSRIVAAVEAFTGSFSLALFVVLFVKKMTR